MYFEVYVSSYLATPGSTRLPESAEAKDCFYNYFIESKGLVVEDWFKGFNRAFMKTMHYFRALRASSMVIEKAVEHVMSGQCKLSLMKMDDCALCAGYSATSLTSCNGLCLNILRGCLLDLSDLVEPITSFSQVLMAMKDHILEFSVYDQIEYVETTVFEFITSVSGLTATISRDVSVLLWTYYII